MEEKENCLKKGRGVCCGDYYEFPDFLATEIKNWGKAPYYGNSLPKVDKIESLNSNTC